MNLLAGVFCGAEDTTMVALILWLEWRRRQQTEPARIPGGEALVTLSLTTTPPVVPATSVQRVLFSVD